MMQVQQDRHPSSTFSTWVPNFASFQPCWYRARILLRINLVFGEQRDIPSSVLFPNSRSNQILSNFSLPQKSCKWVSIQIWFEGKYWVFKDWPWFWPSVSWNTYPKIWTFWLWDSAQFGSTFRFYLSAHAGIASAACPSPSGGLAMTYTTFAAVVCEADEPRSVNTRTLPLYFWNCGSNSAFFEMTSVHQWCKADFVFVSLCFQNDLLFLL